jgi:hypothetical protein
MKIPSRFKRRALLILLVTMTAGTAQAAFHCPPTIEAESLCSSVAREQKPITAWFKSSTFTRTTKGAAFINGQLAEVIERTDKATVYGNGQTVVIVYTSGKIALVVSGRFVDWMKTK